MAIQNDPATDFFSRIQTRMPITGSQITGSVADSFFSNIQAQQPTQPVVQPIVTPQPVQQKNGIATDIKSFIKQAPAKVIAGLDFKKIGQSIVGGAKSLPGMVQQAGGIIASGIIKQKEMTDAFFSPVKKIIGVPTYEVDKQMVNKAKELAGGLREAGVQSQKKASEAFAKTYEPSTGLQGYLEMAAYNLPQVAASTGLSLATTLITKNPALGTAIGLSTSYGLGASEVYNEARQEGLTDAQALPMSMAGGAIIGALDFIPLERLLRKTGAVDVVKKSIIKKVAQGLISLGIQAGFEGITEGAQEVVGNAIAMTYKENHDLFEGVKESAIVGAILGGVSDVTLSGVIGLTSNKSKAVEEKINAALSTPSEERTEEQKQIVEALFTKELTPDEAISYVVDNDLGKTEEGKAIMLASVQAKQEDKIIRISPAEDEKSMEIMLSVPSPLPSSAERIQEPPVASEEEVKPIVGESGGVELAQESYTFKEDVGGNGGNEGNAIKLNGKVIGGYVLDNGNDMPGGQARLEHIEILPEFRRKGLGIETIKQIFTDNPDINVLKGQGIKQSKAFWENIGQFREEGSSALWIERDKFFEKFPIKKSISPTATTGKALTPYDTPEIIAERERIAQLPETADDDSPERKKLREEVGIKLSKLGSYTGKDANGKEIFDGAIQMGKRADIVLGNPGSGKSSIMVNPLSQEHGARVIDSDMAKAMLGSVNDAPLLHRESSDVIENYPTYASLKNGDNVVFPLVGKTSQKIMNLIDSLTKAGYEVHAHFVDLSKEKAVLRVIERFKRTGRFVDPDYVINEVGDKPRATYDIIKGNTNLKSYEKVSSDVPKGQKPTIIEQSDYYRSGRDGSGRIDTSSKQSSEGKPKEAGRKVTSPSKETPVGTGTSKNSRLFERVKEALGEDYEQESRKYNELSLETQAEKVIELIKENPEKSVQIAQGIVEPPPGMTQNAMALALAEIAMEKGDAQTTADLWTDTSLRSTRLGQEIVSLRGSFNGDSPINAVKKLISIRMEQVVSRYKDVIKQLQISPEATMAQKVDALVKNQKTKIKKDLSAIERKLQSAQEIINKLKCT